MKGSLALSQVGIQPSLMELRHHRLFPFRLAGDAVFAGRSRHLVAVLPPLMLSSGRALQVRRQENLHRQEA